MKELGYGKGYQYSHSQPGNFAFQEFMPEEISNVNFFEAGSSRKEQEVTELIQKLWGSKYSK
jgi:putative ATPase